ncbi:MAG: hypothetical protein IJV65_02855 [Kiritimatiellae bacterium]|nr:hypothetical protein [Kiritimatiellia bacterium]
MDNEHDIYVYVPRCDNGEAYLEGKDAILSDEEFDEFTLTQEEFERATPLIESINDAVGSDIDLFEECVLFPDQVEKALAIAENMPSDGSIPVGVADKLKTILETAVSRRYSLWFVC